MRANNRKAGAAVAFLVLLGGCAGQQVQSKGGAAGDKCPGKDQCVIQVLAAAECNKITVDLPNYRIPNFGSTSIRWEIVNTGGTNWVFDPTNGIAFDRPDSMFGDPNGEFDGGSRDSDSRYTIRDANTKHDTKFHYLVHLVSGTTKCAVHPLVINDP